jgi:hypothetical protein
VQAGVFGGWKMAYVSATAKLVAMWAGISTVTDTTDNLSKNVKERNWAVQFAQDIFSLLAADRKTEGKVV